MSHGASTLVMLPELMLFLGGLAALLGGSFTPRTRQWRLRLLAAVAVVASLVLSVLGLAGVALGSGAGGPQAVFDGTFAVDDVTGAARLIVGVSLLLVLLLAGDELAGTPRESETYALMLIGGAGALLLVGTTDLALLVVAFLLASIPVYALIGLGPSRVAPEAAVKTYLLGALLGIGLMLGVVLLYGLAGTTSYADLAGLSTAPAAAVAAGVVLVLGGLLFESGAVPAHFWVPDAAQGSTSTAAAYLTTVPKIGGLVATLRLLAELPDPHTWALLVAVVAALSMTLGNLAAFTQDDPRRLLGWSTVSQVGYLLVPVAAFAGAGPGAGVGAGGGSELAVPALLYFLGAYAVTNIGAFAVVAALPRLRDLRGYRGLGRRSPALASSLYVVLLGLLGTPPTAVFVAKLLAVVASWEAGLEWLAVLLLVNTVASLFYYLRWLAPVLGSGDDDPDAGVEPDREDEQTSGVRPWAGSAAVLAAGLSLVLGLGAGVAYGVVDVALLR